MKTYEDACQSIKKDLVSNPYMRYIYENIIGRDDTRIKIANLYNPLLHAQPNKRPAIEVCGKEIEAYISTLAPNSLNITNTKVPTPIDYPKDTVENDSSKSFSNKQRIGKFIAVAIKSLGLMSVEFAPLKDDKFAEFGHGTYYSFKKSLIEGFKPTEEIKPTEKIKTTITCSAGEIVVEQSIVEIET